MSGAEWQPLGDPERVEEAAGQAQPANMAFYKVVFSIEINTLMNAEHWYLSEI